MNLSRFYTVVCACALTQNIMPCVNIGKTESGRLFHTLSPSIGYLNLCHQTGNSAVIRSSRLRITKSWSLTLMNLDFLWLTKGSLGPRPSRDSRTKEGLNSESHVRKTGNPIRSLDLKLHET